jgi:hypothetical protein
LCTAFAEDIGFRAASNKLIGIRGSNMKKYVVFAFAFVMAATLPFVALAKDNNPAAALPIEKSQSTGPADVVKSPAAGASADTKVSGPEGNAADVNARGATSFGGLVKPNTNPKQPDVK